MANLRIESFGRLRFDAFGAAKQAVRLPLTDGNLYSAEVSAIRHRSGLVTATLRIDNVVMVAPNKDVKDGILKDRMSEQESGQFSALCPLEHATRLFAEFLAEQQITAASFLEIGKVLNIAVDGVAPTRKWSIVPEIAETKEGIAKYLLMRKEDEFIFGWDGSGDPQHSNIWHAHENTDNLGGGFMALYEAVGLRLTDESSTYGQPPFELVYDAAVAVVQAAKQRIAITEMFIEGAEKFKLQ